jgi:hypothetical protein
MLITVQSARQLEKERAPAFSGPSPSLARGVAFPRSLVRRKAWQGNRSAIGAPAVYWAAQEQAPPGLPRPLGPVVCTTGRDHFGTFQHISAIRGEVRKSPENRSFLAFSGEPINRV